MTSAVTETVTASSYTHFILKATKTLIGVVGSVALLGLAGIYTFQSKLVYPAFAGDGHGIVDMPDKYGMDNYKHVDIKTKDGETLKLFIIKQHDQSPISGKTVLILCPNAGNMGHALPIAQLFYYNMNCNVVLYSYRGYGKSSGSPSEAGLKLDADLVMEYIAKDEMLSKTSLLLHGRSLGGAVALYIASKYPERIKGLMLENTFLSIRKVIPYIFPYLANFASLCHQIWDSESLIQSIPSDIPAIFLNGQKDEIVPSDHMTKLYELSQSDNKKFYSFPNGHHNDTIIQEDYWVYIADFVNSIK